MNSRQISSAQPAVAIALIAISLCVVGLMLFSSYRLGINSLEFAWQVNFSRVAAAATAGLAFASVGALLESRQNALIQIVGFNIVSIVSAVVVIGAVLGWHMVLIAGIAMIGGWAMMFFTQRATRQHRNANLILSLVLGLSLVLCMLNFIGASYLNNEIGGIVLWLQGNLNSAGAHSSLSVVIGGILFAWLMFANSKELPACLLLGLGFGIAGPLFFIPLLVPMLIRRLTKLQQGHLFMLGCGIAGAMFAVLADTVPRLLLGGYAPTLAVPIALFSIPVLLWWNRQQVLETYPSTMRAAIEAILLVLWVILSVIVFYHIVEFASLLT